MDQRTQRRNWISGAAGLALLGATGGVFAQHLLPPFVPPENPVTPTKRVLGKILFWEEQLSSDNTTACGTCHVPAFGGADPRPAATMVHPGPDGAIGTDDDIRGSAGVIRSDSANDYHPDALFDFHPQVTTRRAPSVIGAAYFSELFWDGRATFHFVDPETGEERIKLGGGLENVALEPPLAANEMAHDERTWAMVLAKLRSAEPLRLAHDLTPDIVTALADAPTYPDLYESAFGDPAVTTERTVMALGTYMRTLVPDRTHWDKFILGELDALTPQEAQGFEDFVRPETNCITCHLSPLFGATLFRNIGVRPPAEDRGRAEVTGRPQDRGEFKVPTLRNAGLRTGFFHNGGAESLEDVLAFYARGGDFRENQDPAITAMQLTPEMEENIVVFIRGALTDARVANAMPPFDRPRMHSESSPPNPLVFGEGTPGSGGMVPEMIARTPPAHGVPGFKLGVARGLGGSVALLVVRRVGDPADGAGGAGEVGGAGFDAAGRLIVRRAITLPGTDPGEGYATCHLPLEEIAEFGERLWAQWYLIDPKAPTGFAVSPVAELVVE